MTFEELGLHQDIIKALNEQNYGEPTPIQKQAIPPLLEGRDVLGLAKTGTGKTAAFTLPILQKLLTTPVENNPIRALILAPTRELAIQIGENIEKYAAHTELQVGVMFGGITPKRHIKVIKKEPAILVSTPGRLLEFVTNGHITLEHLEMFVLDEADQMLDDSMLKIVRNIIRQLPKRRQNILFSATMPNEVIKLVNGILKNPVKISADANVTTSTNVEIKQYVYHVEEPDKGAALLKWLQEETYESVLVFVRTKTKADKISKMINVANIRNKAIHGDKGQSERQKALDLFKNKEIKVLIATDVAARGIDINKLSHVINLNIPNISETYIHRIGRTGRAGMCGTAISYCSKEEQEFLKEIEKLQGKTLENLTRSKE